MFVDSVPMERGEFGSYGGRNRVGTHQLLVSHSNCLSGRVDQSAFGICGINCVGCTIRIIGMATVLAGACDGDDVVYCYFGL